jgi:hypothetical protein
MKGSTVFFELLVILALSSCSTAPEIIPGRGAVYGTISAESHKDIKAKASKKGNGFYSNDGKIVFTSQMINYDNLKELYVCLIDPGYSGGNEHLITVGKNSVSHRSLAVATGDRLWVQNNTPQTLTFYLAGTDDAIQVFPAVKPNERSAISINLTGELELGSEENEGLNIKIFSRHGMIVQQHSTGDYYAFENLHPGKYNLLFWFWRLGFIEKEISVQAGSNIRLDQILSVDKIMAGKNDSER